MDVVSHGLCGALLGSLDVRRRLGPGSRAAFALGALAPDLDLAVAASGWDRYLYYHDAGTHSLVASPLIALTVAAAIRICVARSSLVKLWLAAWPSVVIGHVALDLLSGADVRLFSPLFDTRFSSHLIAMADVLALWVLAVGFAATFYSPRPAAIGTFLVLALLLLTKSVTQARAVASFSQPVGADPARRSLGHADAINGSLFMWRMYDRGNGEVRVWIVDSRTGARTLEFARQVDDYLENTAVRVPAIETFLGLAHIPFARVEMDGGRKLVMWSDLRDCDAGRCAASVGVELDATGQARRQVIRIGPIEQSREVPSRNGNGVPLAPR